MTFKRETIEIHVVVCDGVDDDGTACDDQATYDDGWFGTDKDAWDYAEDIGYEKVDGKHYCEDCTYKHVFYDEEGEAHVRTPTGVQS